jgi:hypothetical protein
MNTPMKKNASMLMILLTITLSVQSAFDIYENISNAIRNGNSSEISNFFNTNVDLTIGNQEEVYSKAQAEQVLKDFFVKNTPRSFTLIHQGLSKEGAKYAIGNLTTQQGNNYRTYFFIKQVGRSEFIQELRFEKE